MDDAGYRAVDWAGAVVAMNWKASDLPKHMRPKVSEEAVADAVAVKRSKYGNIPVTIDGMRFDSKLEGRCYQWLLARNLAGEVLWFIRQPSFLLEGHIRYRPDFLAALANGGVEVIDAKGMLNQVSANKIKCMKDRYNINVILWRGK